MRRFSCAICLVGILSCGRPTPPTWDGGGASPSVAPRVEPPAPSASASTTEGPSAGASAASSVAPTAPRAADSTDPGALPQTRDEPSPSGAAFDARVAALWDAIVHDDPERAMPFFFPLSAYEQVKDVASPKRDWEHRLVARYRRDIHALHRRLGDHAEEAKLLGIDVPMSRARWVEPGEEWNKIGYYRVFGSRLRYELDGQTRSFEVTSLISWRGEWYVVHLTGVK